MRETQFLDLIKVANPQTGKGTINMRSIRKLGIYNKRYAPCNHPGCGSHITHACEGCGVHWGMMEDGMPFKTTVEDVDHMFKYHAPKPDQIAKYEELREAARMFAQIVLRVTPGCPDATAAFC